MGAGHVMRCLTLAEALRSRGASVAFLSLPLAGNLHEMLERRQFRVLALEPGAAEDAWNGADWWRRDAELTAEALLRAGGTPEWLVVDHYGLDARWMQALRQRARHILAIDDLANRRLDCDLLLDQNSPSPRHRAYLQLIPHGAGRLLGPAFALVRPEFARLREAALARRDGRLERILICMGASDPANDSAKALAGLMGSSRAGLAVDVVVGASNPHASDLDAICRTLPHARLHVQTEQMAQLMANADLAICACGSTTWERCVVGLPALAIVQSADQATIGDAVAQAGAHRLLGPADQITADGYRRAIESVSAGMLAAMAAAAAGLCDGRGTDRVADAMFRIAGAATCVA